MPVKLQVELKNVGKAKVAIAETKGGCDCVVPETVKRELAPGEKIFLPITFNPARKSGPESASVRVFWNSPDGTPLTISVNSTVEDLVDVQPKNIFLESGLESTVEPARVTLMWRSGTPVSIEHIDAPDCLSYTVDPSNGPSASHSIAFQLNRYPGLGALKGDIVVATSDRYHGQIHIPYTVNGRGRLFAEPSIIHLGQARVGERKTFTLNVARLDGTPFEISAIRTSAKGYDFVIPTDKASEHTLSLSWTAESDESLQDVIQISGGEGEYELVKVPISASIR